MSFVYTDLIGKPYLLHGRFPEGLDCSTICEEVLTRLGLAPPPTSPFRYAGNHATLAEFEGYMDQARESVELVGQLPDSATRPGDFVLTSAGGCSVARGMFVLVDRDLFLTSFPRSGVTPVTRQALARLKPAIIGVYRCVREAPC